MTNQVLQCSHGNGIKRHWIFFCFSVLLPSMLWSSWYSPDPMLVITEIWLPGGLWGAMLWHLLNAMVQTICLKWLNSSFNLFQPVCKPCNLSIPTSVLLDILFYSSYTFFFWDSEQGPPVHLLSHLHKHCHTFFFSNILNIQLMKVTF